MNIEVRRWALTYHGISYSMYVLMTGLLVVRCLRVPDGPNHGQVDPNAQDDHFMSDQVGDAEKEIILRIIMLKKHIKVS